MQGFLENQGENRRDAFRRFARQATRDHYDSDPPPIIALRDQLESARTAGDHQRAQDLLLELAETLEEQRFNLRATLAYQEARHLAIELSWDKPARLRALSGLGRTYLRTYRDEFALLPLREALQLTRDLADPEAEAQCLILLTAASLHVRNPSQALQYAQQAHVLFGSLGMQRWAMNALNYAALAHKDLGQFDKAARIHQRAILLAREWNSSELEAPHLANLGSLQVQALGMPEQGMRLLLRALELAQTRGDQVGEAKVLGMLTESAMALSRWQEAETYMEQAFTIANRRDDLHDLAHALRPMAETIYFRLGYLWESARMRCWPSGQDPLLGTGARADRHSGLHMARRRGDKRAEAGLLLALALNLNREHDGKRFLSYAEQALTLFREVGDRQELIFSLYTLGKQLASSSVRIRGKRAMILALMQVSLDLGIETSRVFKDNAIPAVRQCAAELIAQMRARWGEHAFQRAQFAGEQIYSRLLTAFSFIQPEQNPAL